MTSPNSSLKRGTMTQTSCKGFGFRCCFLLSIFFVGPPSACVSARGSHLTPEFTVTKFAYDSTVHVTHPMPRWRQKQDVPQRFFFYFFFFCSFHSIANCSEYQSKYLSTVPYMEVFFSSFFCILYGVSSSATSYNCPVARKQRWEVCIDDAHSFAACSCPYNFPTLPDEPIVH
jgi:hypothetical protein